MAVDLQKLELPKDPNFLLESVPCDEDERFYPCAGLFTEPNSTKYEVLLKHYPHIAALGGGHAAVESMQELLKARALTQFEFDKLLHLI